MKYCSSCRNGEIKQEADYLVTGYMGYPVKMYVCKDHLSMMLNDGLEIKKIELISEEVKEEKALELIRANTAYLNVEEIGNNCPTLRSFKEALWLKLYLRNKGYKVA